MLTDKYPNIKEEYVKIIGFIFIISFILFRWFNLESLPLLIVVLIVLTLHYVRNMILFLKNYKKTDKALHYKSLDLLFNAFLFYSLYLGLFFSSQSKYFYFFSDKFTLFAIIKLTIVFMYSVFLIKKFYVHIPLEYSFLSNGKKKFGKYLFILFPVLWLLVLTYTNPFEENIILSSEYLLEFVFIIPFLLFIFATYLDLVSFFNQKWAIELRCLVHFIDITLLNCIVSLGIKYVIPNLAINQSLVLPLVYIIPFIWLVHQIREYILYYASKIYQTRRDKKRYEI